MWPDEPLALHPDKSCMFNFMPDENSVTWFTTHAALAPKDSTLPAGLPGHYFIMNKAPQFQRTPFIAQFDADALDVIVFAYKVSELRVYAYGIPLDKLTEFKPPSNKSRGQEVDEAAYFSSYKLPHSGNNQHQGLVEHGDAQAEGHGRQHAPVHPALQAGEDLQPQGSH